MISLIGNTTAELGAIAETLGEPVYRGRQLASWIYSKGAEQIVSMTDLPKRMRDRMHQALYSVGLPEAVHCDKSEDGAMKYLLKNEDGLTVESVYLPYQDRVSACLSSQIGCAAGCAFCATAQGGLARNLTAGEIVGQYLRMQRESDRRISHVVYMGMGEPLWNYDAVIKSIRILGGEIGLSYRHITVSTVGVVPGIRALAAEEIPVTLALSLHAPDDETRTRLIPTGRKWKIDEIMDACRYYTNRTLRNLTFEYLLIGGVNDSADQAVALAELLNKHNVPGNVNLIPFNYVETSEGYRRPTRDNIAAFRAVLESMGRVTTQRMTRGHSVSAACGQLRRNLETNLTTIPLRMASAGTG